MDGADGTGKSTQIELLRQRLAATGARVVVYDFPAKSGSPIGNLIGDFLRGRYGSIEPEFVGLAFAVDRCVARSAILQDLEDGAIVVCDRYVRANIAFQGAKTSDVNRQKEIRDLLEWVEYGVNQMPLPDVELIFTADNAHFSMGAHLCRGADSSRAYMSEEADIHEQSGDLQLAVNSYYSSLTDGPSLKRIPTHREDGSRLTIAEVSDLVFQAVKAVIDMGKP